MSINILDKFLKKIGVNSYEELSPEEQKTFSTWQDALSGRSVTQDEYRAFLESELNEAIARMIETNLSPEDTCFRKMEVRLLRKIIFFLDMPKVEKKLLEKQLEAQL